MPIIVMGGTLGTNVGDLNQVRCWAGDLKAQGLVGIAIRAHGVQRYSTGSQSAWHLLKGIECQGTGLRETKIQATGTDPPPTSQDYYLNKIAARFSGRTRAIVQDIGQASEAQARSHARRLLQAVVDHGTEREYEIISMLPAALPELGDTVLVDDYTGVVSSLTWSAQGEAETLVLRLTDYTATVLQ